MKKLFLSLIVMMTAATASAQWAVTDAGNLSQNLKNFKVLQKQVGYLQQQKKLLDESLDMMRKVNSVVSTVRRPGILSNARQGSPKNASICSAGRS